MASCAVFRPSTPHSSQTTISPRNRRDPRRETCRLEVETLVGTHGGDILLIYRGLNYQRLIWLINLDFIGEQTYYRGNTKSTSCWEWSWSVSLTPANDIAVSSTVALSWMWLFIIWHHLTIFDLGQSTVFDLCRSLNGGIRWHCRRCFFMFRPKPLEIWWTCFRAPLMALLKDGVDWRASVPWDGSSTTLFRDFGDHSPSFSHDFPRCSVFHHEETTKFHHFSIWKSSRFAGIIVWSQGCRSSLCTLTLRRIRSMDPWIHGQWMISWPYINGIQWISLDHGPQLQWLFFWLDSARLIKSISGICIDQIDDMNDLIRFD